ncbi:MAG TPA: polysaccharide biosynthesis/export family protein [Candidatus Binataceae bacterium]|jgi:hypothetical protein
MAPSNGALGGTANFPSGVNVNGIVGAASKLSPQQVNAAMQTLGISPSEALLLQQQLATGVISPQEVQSLCAHLAASNISPAMVQTVAGTVGLNAAQLQQIQGCLPGGSGTLTGQPPPLQAGQAPPMVGMPGMPGQPPPGVAMPVSGGAAAPPPTGPPSLIEQNYGQVDLQLPPSNPTPTSLSQFGYSIFASTVSTFAPLGNIPVGPDYVLGPGDQLNIYMWGRLNQTLPVTIDRDGSVEVTGIEPLQIGGSRLIRRKS